MLWQLQMIVNCKYLQPDYNHVRHLISTVKLQVLTLVTDSKNIFGQKVTVHKHQKSPS